MNLVESDVHAKEQRDFLIERVGVYLVYSVAALVTLATLLFPLYVLYQLWRHGWH